METLQELNDEATRAEQSAALWRKRRLEAKEDYEAAEKELNDARAEMQALETIRNDRRDSFNQIEITERSARNLAENAATRLKQYKQVKNISK